MAWINPLDRLPQIPQDYANHMLWAAFGWFAIMLVWRNPNEALAAMAAIGAIKKVVDFIAEGESGVVCVSKTVVTALGAAIPWAAWMLRGAS
jgi:hypothetical protein